MTNFDELEIVDKVENDKKDRISINDNYVIGADPFDQIEDSKVSVFSMYDKRLMRKVITMTTNKPFSHFVDVMMQGEIIKDFTVSKKFINNDGKAKKPSEIRSEYNGFERNLTTQL